jgi:hypothetical protein
MDPTVERLIGYDVAPVFLDDDSDRVTSKKVARIADHSAPPFWSCSHDHVTSVEVADCTESPFKGDGEFLDANPIRGVSSFAAAIMNDPSKHEAEPLHRAFAPLIGLPAWSVRKGHGSFLTLEFGPPRLEVREPIMASPDASDRVRARLARRQVIPRGEWHLWIYCCHWRVLTGGTQIAWSDASDSEIDAAAGELDGRTLTDVEADPTRGTSKFSFEQGASIETWPYDDGNDEQWMLYMKSGGVLSYRADGSYSLDPE